MALKLVEVVKLVEIVIALLTVSTISAVCVSVCPLILDDFPSFGGLQAQFVKYCFNFNTE